MAVTMSLRLDESAGVLPRVPVLMLLDRAADLHLARRCGADGWLIKPLDPLRLRRASDVILAGGRYTEGLAADAADVDPMVDLGAGGDADAASPDQQSGQQSGQQTGESTGESVPVNAG
jgi:DNA-binding response OmpR family regulator